jgi:hypothetical protein
MIWLEQRISYTSLAFQLSSTALTNIRPLFRIDELELEGCNMVSRDGLKETLTETGEKKEV